MLVWDPEGADDRVWARLREHFTDAQIVEIGAFVSLTFGQQRVIKTWGVGERERTALEWAAAIAWDSARADDALWSRLHALFTEPELVDLGCAIGFELGRQHWRRSVGLPARGA